METHREKCLKRQTSDPTQGKLKYAKAPKIADPKHTQGLNDAARLVYEDNFPITSVASSAVLLTVLTSLPILEVTAIPITKPSYHTRFDPITDPIIAFVTNPEVEQEQKPRENEDREAVVVGAGLCDGEGERAYTANSGRFGKRRLGKNIAADVSAKKICRNVSG